MFNQVLDTAAAILDRLSRHFLPMVQVAVPAAVR